MKKIVDDIRMIYKCCSLYYEDGKNQQEICDYLGISRSTVSRMLKLGYELGIVKIEVINPVKFGYGEIEKALQKKYKLKDIIVVHTNALDTKNDLIAYLNEEALTFLNNLFSNGDYIGVSMGHTLYNMTKIKKKFDDEKELTFMPLIGGISQNKINKDDIQSNNVAQRFAKIFGGKYLQFLSPAVFSSKEVLDGFLMEKSVNYIFEYYKKLNTVIMGVGVPEREKSTLISNDYVTKEYMNELIEKGVVGDVVLHFFDKDGNLELFNDFNDRVSAISMDMMKKVKNRVAIVNGEEKAEAVKAAIKGGFCNILITDVSCAEKLLE